MEPYVGFCWAKESIWVDFMNPKSKDHLKSLYCSVPDETPDKENYIFTDNNVHIWNDMNEPSCFDPYDKSMPKSNIHMFDPSSNL